jgi:hypothetical protein
MVETGAKVVEIMDLKLDPVKIVAAVPSYLRERDLRNKKTTFVRSFLAACKMHSLPFLST